MLQIRGKTEEEILAKSDKAILEVENLFLNSPLPEFPLITKSQIAKIPLFTKYDLADGVWGWRLPSEFEDDALIILCEFAPSARLRFHKHDCKEEIIRIDGEFKGMDDRITYDVGEVHELINRNKPSRIIVKFY